MRNIDQGMPRLCPNRRILQSEAVQLYPPEA